MTQLEKERLCGNTGWDTADTLALPDSKVFWMSALSINSAKALQFIRPKDQGELTAKWVLIQDSLWPFDFSLSPSITQWEQLNFAHKNSECLGQQFYKVAPGGLCSASPDIP